MRQLPKMKAYSIDFREKIVKAYEEVFYVSFLQLIQQRLMF